MQQGGHRHPGPLQGQPFAHLDLHILDPLPTLAPGAGIFGEAPALDADLRTPAPVFAFEDRAFFVASTLCYGSRAFPGGHDAASSVRSRDDFSHALPSPGVQPYVNVSLDISQHRPKVAIRGFRV